MRFGWVSERAARVALYESLGWNAANGTAGMPRPGDHFLWCQRVDAGPWTPVRVPKGWGDSGSMDAVRTGALYFTDDCRGSMPVGTLIGAYFEWEDSAWYDGALTPSESDHESRRLWWAWSPGDPKPTARFDGLLWDDTIVRPARHRSDPAVVAAWAAVGLDVAAA